MDALTEFAVMFKNNENPKQVSMTTGVVISPPPNAQIRLNDTVILYNNQLVFAAHILDDYERELELDGNIKFADASLGETTFEAKNVKSKTKDTLKEGNEVILLPTEDENLYYVVGKAVRFE